MQQSLTENLNRIISGIINVEKNDFLNKMHHPRNDFFLLSLLV